MTLEEMAGVLRSVINEMNGIAEPWGERDKRKELSRYYVGARIADWRSNLRTVEYELEEA